MHELLQTWIFNKKFLPAMSSAVPKAPKDGKKKKGKVGKKKAQLIIQTFARGWLVRHFYLKFREEVRSSEFSGREFLESYKTHMNEIKTRHDVEEHCNIRIDFREIYDYLVKRNLYEEAFDVIAEGGKLIAYSQIPAYFEFLKLQATGAEIRFAAEKVLQDNSSKYKEFEYSKREILDIALHIFTPKGTGLTDTRKSTWMCPLVGNDDCLRQNLKKDEKKIKLSKCINIVSKSIKNEKVGEVQLTASEQMLHDIKYGPAPGTEPAASKSKKKQKKK